MAIPFLNNIDLNDNQLLNAKLHVTSSTPAAEKGQIYFDSTQTPDVIDTAKYYDGSAWISLVEHTFNNGTFINLTEVGTGAARTLTADLSAGGTPSATTYLRGDNSWEPISAIPGTYKFTISDNASPAVSAIVAEDDTLTIAASADLTSNLTNPSATEKLLTIGLKVDGGLGVADNYIVNQGTAVAAADDSIPFNQTEDYGNPAFDTDIVKKTTFGTIPVNALTLVKQYIDDSVAGGLIYQGGYDANLNIPDLDGPPSPNNIKKGWTYTVTDDGLFFTEQVRVGDVLIAEVDAPTSLDDWTTVQNNVDLASLTQVGIGNVIPATNAPLKGLSVAYSNGTATAGLNIAGLTTQAPSNNALAFIPFYDQFAGANLKVGLSTLAGDLNEYTSKAYTISDTATITYPFTLAAGAENDTIIQLVDTATGETVYADVERISATQATITFASTPANDIRVLVQKIG